MRFTREELRAEVIAAFPPKPYFGSVMSCTCDECAGIKKHVAGKAWDELTVEFLDDTRGPALMNAPACVAFLPAYLIRALDVTGKDNIGLELTAYTLCPSTDWLEKAELLNERNALLTEVQRLTVRRFLEFARQQKEGTFFKELVDQALESHWK